MQLSALTVPVRGISQLCCHKSTFTSVMTGIEIYFFSRERLWCPSYKGCEKILYSRVSGKGKLQIRGNEEEDERQSEGDGEERDDVAADREGSQVISRADIANVQR